MQYSEQYKKWLGYSFLTEAERAELISISDNTNEQKARFGSQLTFGTAGLRGKMQLGTNAMNAYTVAQATQGLAMYINSVDSGGSVVIAYDSRRNSELFARTAASVLAGNGISVFIFDALRPTPELSFALRYLGCIAGINITASHNPKEYNGYKAYWDDGAQLSPEQAEKIAALMNGVDIEKDIKRMDFSEGISTGRITVIGSDIDKKYLDAVMAQCIDRDIIDRAASSLNIVYTPLHGAGWRLIPEILSRIGIKNLHTVPEQLMPDGDFPTTKKPNPEYPEVFACGIPIADRVGSDLIIATDPDADRVGIMVRSSDGRFITLNGNQTGALLLDYIINAYHRRGSMPSEPYAVKSIVTTELMDKICRAGNVELYNVLTGFKYIGEVIKKKEAQGHGSFIFGAEESYGYLKGTYARDKDAVVATMLICEMTAYYKTRNMTLSDALAELYKRYGYSLEKTQELVFDGYDGAERIAGIMRALRSPSIHSIGNTKISTFSDYLTGFVTDADGGRKSTGLPSSDVLRFCLDNSDVIIARPSGTEPKLKLYYLLSADSEKEASEKLEQYSQALTELTAQTV